MGGIPRVRGARSAAWLMAAACLVGSGWAVSPPLARAAAFSVTNLLDDGPGSLRAAIAGADTTPGADTITFSVSGTIALVTPLPAITDATGLVLDGAGQAITVSGENLVRPFSIAAGGSLEVRNLTVQGGKATAASGGAFLNQGSLTLRNSLVRENYADLDGGAISSSGTLALYDTVVLGNNADVAGGGIASTGTLTVQGGALNANSAASLGGAVLSKGPLSIKQAELTGNQVQPGTGGAIEADTTTAPGTIEESRFTQNLSYGGGAIRNIGGSLTVLKSTFSENVTARRRRVSYPGAGIANVSGGSLTVVASTFDRNHASLTGGAIHHTGLALTVANSTLSSNEATNGPGGGLYLAGPATVVNTTITGNVSGVSGGGVHHASAGGAASLANSVLATNTAPASPDCGSTGAIAGAGPNLVQDATDCPFSGTAPAVAPALLAPLADNGGPTRTQAPFVGSPLVDAGSGAVCAAAPVANLDQRGVSRPAGAACDLGAVEGTTAAGPLLNGDFELGSLGWTLSGVNGGIARVETQGSCFGANNTKGVTLPGGKQALNVRSSSNAPLDSAGIATSGLVRFGAKLTFAALSENDDASPDPLPVSFLVSLLNTSQEAVQVFDITSNLVTLSPGTSNDGCLVGDLRNGPFSVHELDTTALAGQLGHLQFRQHTNVPGKGFFTLVDNISVQE